MNIISWDVSIKNLANSILMYVENNIIIIDFGIIDITDNCCKFENCKNNDIIKLQLIIDDIYIKKELIINVCLIHYKYIQNCILEKNINTLIKLFNILNIEKWLLINDNYICSSCNNKWLIYNLINRNKYCEIHFLEKFKKYKKDKCNVEIIKKNLIKQLMLNDKYINVDQVIIENQPSLKNPKMKSICCCIYDFYLIKKIDVLLKAPWKKLFNWIIQHYNLDNEYNKIKNENSKWKKYSLTKKFAIRLCEQLFFENKKLYDMFFKCKKKDDLCDSFLLNLNYIDEKFKIDFKLLNFIM